LDICASFVTGIDDPANFFPCQNHVSSRLMEDCFAKMAKQSSKAKNCSK
jgi:hypothetical protein